MCLKVLDRFRQARRLMHTHPQSDYLLSGLVTCADCGVPMAGTRRNNWGTKVRGYTCRRSWAGAKNTGCGRFVRADPLEDAIWTKVAGWVADPDLLVTAVTGETAGVGEQVRDEIRQIEQALRNAEQGKRLSVLERHLAESDELPGRSGAYPATDRGPRGAPAGVGTQPR